MNKNLPIDYVSLIRVSDVYRRTDRKENII